MSCRYETNKLPGWVTHISYYSIPITVILNNSLSKRIFVFIHAWQHFIYSNIEIIASVSNNCSSFRDFQTAPNFETTSSLALPESRFLEKRPPASNNAPANGKLPPKIKKSSHYSNVITGTMASQITGVSVAYSIDCPCAAQRKHQSSLSLAFVRGINRWPVNSLHKGPVTRFPFDDAIVEICMYFGGCVNHN